MNCIDAVEGTAKSVLSRFLDLSAEFRMDASEYIRNVKAVIEAVNQFVKNNPEISDNPEIICGVLYDHARSQWLERMGKAADAEADAAIPDVEYQAYCYDYVFANGNFPR